ncbi:hypothetical protein Bca52824_052827 [Brassica carinata]|uniref:Transmembrane protein n=1 Tax=Brassica carinata TaxID=52824 RepID=A0A8X7R570_BRACI|nr:hypothetical protein Bca52824_052827 [Brassica carinata]
MANIFLIASGSRRTRRAMKSKNPQEKRSNRAMKSKNPQEKRSNSISVNNFSCKKHKKHRQSPGICSLCLTERLSKISIEYYDILLLIIFFFHVGVILLLIFSVSSCSSPLQYRFREKKKDGKKHSFVFRLLLGSIVD